MTELMVRWQQRLRLTGWRGTLQQIAREQVTGEDGKPGAELVGVIIEDSGRFTIVHTRELGEDDLIHELLHVAFPRWRHEQVELWTDILAGDPAALARLWSLSDSGEEEDDPWQTTYSRSIFVRAVR
jgi:hypothetical protein